MLGLSLDTWNSLIAIFAIGAAVLGLLSGAATYVAYRLQKSDATAEKAEFDRYKLDAGKAIAEADARAKEAQLALEMYKAPRNLSVQQEAAIIAALSPLKGATFSICTLPGDEETFAFARQIEAALKKAGLLGEIDDGFMTVVTGMSVAPNSEGGLHPADAKLAAAVAGALNGATVPTKLAAPRDLAIKPRKSIQIGVGKKQ